jgi:hypothetical protein
MKKVLVIESCYECPYMEYFGEERECTELGVKLRSKKSFHIYKNCPLQSVKEFLEESESPWSNFR